MSDNKKTVKDGVKSGVLGAGIAGAGTAGAGAIASEEMLEKINATGAEITESLQARNETLQSQMEAKMGELSEALTAQVDAAMENAVQDLNSNGEQLKSEMESTAREAIASVIQEGREEITVVMREAQEELNHIAQQVEYAIREHKDRAVAEMESFKDDLTRFTADARTQIEQEIDRVKISASNACNDLERDCSVYKESLESTSHSIQEQINTVAESALTNIQGSVVVDGGGKASDDDVEFS